MNEKINAARSEVRDGMKVDWDVPIPMNDGIVLRADLFRPNDDKKYPVIVSYGAFGKGLAFQEGNKSAPAFTEKDLNGWSQLFGRIRGGPDAVVDLIAFSAALDRRLENFFKGDFRLTPADAIDAMRTHYLQKISGQGERNNLLRLAALSEFEIDLPDDLLDDPSKAFDECINKLGIVLVRLVGLERRNSYVSVVRQFETDQAFREERPWLIRVRV